VTPDLVSRIKREAVVVASSGLDKDEIRTKIEWQARQILSKQGGPKSRKVFRLVEDTKDSTIAVKTIRLNNQLASEKFIPTFVTLEPKINLRKLTKV